MKKIISIALIILMLTNSVMCFAEENNEISMPDIESHWAYITISQWIMEDLVKGYPDNTFKPDGNITRAEFITLINRVFGYFEEADENYSDIEDTNWYSNSSSIAKENKYMDWYDDSDLNPNENITRQEVCAIISSIGHLLASDDFASIDSFSDKSSIPAWSYAYVDATVNNGYMKGYEDNTLRPEGSITRAESIVMLDRFIGTYISNSTVFGDYDNETVVDGNMTISSKDVQIINTVIKGDLILAAGIEDGDILLDEVTVDGNIIVNGGGENTVTIRNSNLENLYVFKFNNKIRILSEDSEIVKIFMESGGNLEGEFVNSRIQILGKGKKVNFNGDFDKIEIEAESKINVDKNSKISKITFKAPAEMTGSGKILRAIIESNGVTAEQRVYRKTVADGIDGSYVRLVKRSSSSSSSTPSDTESPLPGDDGSTTLSAITFDSLTLNWLKATDNKTSQENLEYSVYYSLSDNLDTVENIESNGLAAGNMTADIESKTVSGLTENTTYYLNVLVNDESGNKSAYTSIETTTKLSDPDGSAEKPFLITTIEDLANIGSNNNGWDVYKSYKLMNDLDFSDSNSYASGLVNTLYTQGDGWTPLPEFFGHFDGNGHVIDNLFIYSNEQYGGLFKILGVDSTIKNLGLENINIDVSSTIGSIAGYSYGTITNCYSTGNILGHDLSAGGLVGDNYEGTIENSYSSVDISFEDSKGRMAGGITGSNYGGTIKNCYSTGDITVNETSASAEAGGIAGRNEDSPGNTALITNCYSTGQVASNGSSTYNSYAGGIAGHNRNASIIKSCAFNQQVNASKSANRVIGYLNDGSILNNYANIDMVVMQNASVKTGTSDSRYGWGEDITSLQFMDENTYTDDSDTPFLDWDFDTIWEFKSEAVRPTLINVGDDKGLIPDILPPSPGNSGQVEAYDMETDSITLSWTKATDNQTQEENLEYLVYYSENNNLDTVENTEANGTASGSFTKDIESKTVTGLTENTLYYFNVIVKDEEGNKSLYTSTSKSTTSINGTGTINDPFKIRTIEDLATIGRTDITPEWSLDQNYILVNNLDFNDTSSYSDFEDTVLGDINEDGSVSGIKEEMITGKGWKPIGNDSNFTGKFLGNNKTISNLYINRIEESYPIGLFSIIYDNNIENLGLIDCNVRGNKITGSIVGQCLSYSVGVNLVNCFATGNVTSITAYAGGLAGYGKSFTNCHADVTVTGESHVGGMVGYQEGGSNIDCFATGNVTAQTGFAGGLIGTTSSYEIRRCYATGNVITTNGQAGGLVGHYASVGSGYIKASYATGDVTVKTAATNYGCVGGLVGEFNAISIYDSYATGNVTGLQSTGGLAGKISNRNIWNCYATGNVTGSTIIGGLIGMRINNYTNKYSFSTGNVTEDGTDASTTNRVVGWLYNSTLENIYAYSQSMVNDSPVTDDITEPETTVNGKGMTLDDIQNITDNNPYSNWSLEDDEYLRLYYWKIEEGTDRPVLYVDPDKDGTYEKLGDDNGLLLP